MLFKLNETHFYPDIFLLGERKSASTSIAQLLFKHEEFCQTAQRREGQYFNKDKEIEWMFSESGEKKYYHRYKGNSILFIV
jgi:hypothetical protein